LVEAVKSVGNQIADWKSLYDRQKGLVEEAEKQAREFQELYEDANRKRTAFTSEMSENQDQLVAGYTSIIAEYKSKVEELQSEVDRLMNEKPVRVRTHSDPERDDGCKCDGREEVVGEFVVTGGDTAKVLQAAERGFDAPALAIALHIMADRALAVSAARDDRPGAGGLEAASQSIGVIALIGNETRQRPCVGEHLVGRPDVADIAGGETDDCRPPEQVRQGMDLGCLATARRADGLRPGPPFPPWAERWALM
jgi:hypothetical protein